MNITYDKKVDASYITLTGRKIARSSQVQPGIIIDFDEDDGVVGIEVLSVSKRGKAESKASQAKPQAVGHQRRKTSVA
jgi:uncharacterized protein YuzE